MRRITRQSILVGLSILALVGFALLNGRRLLDVASNAFTRTSAESSYLSPVTPPQPHPHDAETLDLLERGSAYLNGQGVSQDYTEAVKSFRVAAERGNAKAQVELGCMYGKGQGVPQDQAEAERWLRKATESKEEGDYYLRLYVAQLYEKGQCVLPDMAAAEKIYNKEGHPEGEKVRLLTGLMFPETPDNRRDLLWAVKHWRAAAEQGNAKAQHFLGELYLYGYGVRGDIFQARNWFGRAAVQGLPEAQCAFGSLSHSESEIFLGGDVYYAPASSETTHDETGKLLRYGPDEEEKWYRKAAAQGYVPAEYALAQLYLQEGKDFREAVRWLHKAAEHDNVNAQIYLASMYYRGDGVKQDYAEAAKWYRRGADKNDALAQLELGLLYSAGKGVPQDDSLAYMWLDLASRRYKGGKGKAEHDNITKRMPPEQLAKAQQMAREWKPKTGQ